MSLHLSNKSHYASGFDSEEFVSHTSASGIWTEGTNIHNDGGIFCPKCEAKKFFSWMYTFCTKCGFKRPKKEN